MHTVIVIAVGFGVLGLCALVGRVLAGTPGATTAAIVFLPLWFVGSAINLYVGVKREGYSVKEEASIFLLIFSVPAVVALFLWGKWR
jgi:hypothetical protein